MREISSAVLSSALDHLSASRTRVTLANSLAKRPLGNRPQGSAQPSCSPMQGYFNATTPCCLRCHHSHLLWNNSLRKQLSVQWNPILCTCRVDELNSRHYEWTYLKIFDYKTRTTFSISSTPRTQNLNPKRRALFSPHDLKILGLRYLVLPKRTKLVSVSGESGNPNSTAPIQSEHPTFLNLHYRREMETKKMGIETATSKKKKKKKESKSPFPPRPLFQPAPNRSRP